MPSLAIARWVLVRSSRHPSTWLWLSFTGLLWLGTLAFNPVGITTARAGLAPVFYELAFVSAIAGCSVALLPLSEAQWFLSRAEGAARLRMRAAGLLAGGAFGLAWALLLPALSARMSLLGLGELARDSCATLLHVTALGLLLLGAPLGGAARALALPTLCWALPATLPDAGLPARTLRALLDASAHFGSSGLPAAGASLGRWAALLTLCGAALLIETRPQGCNPHGPPPAGAR